MALIKCPECGKEISNMAQSCPNCGRPLQINQSEILNEQQGATSANQQRAAQQSRPKKKKRGCLITVIIIFFIFGGLCAAISSAIKETQENPDKYKKKSVLASTLELTDEQEENILSIFIECGIGEISAVETFQAGEGHTSYYMQDDEISQIVVWILNDEKTVESIYYNDFDIYVDGQVIAPITNYYVNSEDKDKYRTLTQEAIKQVLNYPDTAKFRGISAWNFNISDNGLIIAQSSVTAENAFGQKSTSDFQATYNNNALTSLILDGQEYIQQ